MATRRLTLPILTLVGVLFALASFAPEIAKADGNTPAYFVFEQEAPDKTVNRFVFKLEDAARIDEARSILAGNGGNKRSVQGIIVKSRAPYNPQWSYHLDPPTISFFEMAIELCDANITYVEEHLDEVGGSTLPRGHWCPWSSRLTAEVTDTIEPATEKSAP